MFGGDIVELHVDIGIMIRGGLCFKRGGLVGW